MFPPNLQPDHDWATTRRSLVVRCDLPIGAKNPTERHESMQKDELKKVYQFYDLAIIFCRLAKDFS